MIAPGRLESNETSSFVRIVVASVGGGGGAPVAVPTQLRSPPCPASQKVQLVAGLIQGATHSHTLPTMSCTPHDETQPGRSPARAAKGELVARVAVKSSPEFGSGVPAAAPCHSSLVRSRLSERRHACSAWNQLRHVLGRTPGTETAYSGAVQLPVGGNSGGYSRP